MFFENLTLLAGRKLHDLSQKLQIPYRSWHALRHTRATHLIGTTGDFMLARLWLGHKKQEVLDRYVHVYQSIVRSAKQGKATLQPIPL